MAFLQDVINKENVQAIHDACDLQRGDIVRLRMNVGSYTTFNKIPTDVDRNDWRPRGPKLRAGSSSLIILTEWGHGEHWVKIVVPGEGQGWIRRSYVQVIE